MVARVLLACLSFLSGTAVSMAQEAAAEVLWQNTCAGCHDDAATLARNLPGEDETAKRAMLDGFLARHHARDAAGRTALISWLLAQPRE
jgi:hypothetical protein